MMDRRRALMAHGKGPTILHGYETVGSPSITNGILDLNVKGAIRTPELFSPGANDTWSIEWSTNWNEVSSEQVHHYLMSDRQTPSASEGFFVSIRGGGTRVSLVLGTTVINNTLGAQEVANGNNDFYFRFTGSAYQFRNITKSTGRSGNSTRTISSCYVFFGNNANGNQQNATIDLRSIKIYLNDKLWWTPLS